ncbi:STAS domain-containing protein [Streptomyces sp. H28]|uniref:STAS domain-containing protein n=1 Tax=Streptomyces sp. H28 TaxID=2775865 RepID=UPI001786E28F|nr:STAS domain-containing protein [Streptomyces sp. H28]MBD9735794.1 STAS domain-containing protein [Streptomyces sp. H28]
MRTHHRTPYGPGSSAPRPTVFPLDGRRGVRAAGEVGPATRTVREGVLERAVREGDGVYCPEPSDVTVVDVAGAGALVAAAGRLGAGRRFVVHRPPPALQRVPPAFRPDLPTTGVSMS